LPAGVRSFLETHLFDAMAANGYDLRVGARPAASIDLTRCRHVSPDGTTAPTADGGLAVTVLGDDFWVESAPTSFSAREVSEVWVWSAVTPASTAAPYWRGAREAFAETSSVRLPFRPGGHWQIVCFRPAGHPRWRGTVAQLRLDLFNDAVEPGRGGEVRWVRLVE
jgi:hypothetical protein